MKTHTNQISKILNEILVKNIDAQNGFQRAIDHTDNDVLISYFRNRSTELSKFISELKDKLTQYKEDYAFSGSIAEDIHMGWIDFKSLFTKFTDKTVLKVTISGEEAALKEYNEALKTDIFPKSTYHILRSQRNSIEADINKLRAIKDAAFS